MLQAILSGKAGTAAMGGEDRVSWRKIFKANEDLLTATVFERISYLRGPICWKILRSTFGHILPEYHVANLRNIEFWPRWSDVVDPDKSVEPDVFMQFDLGDPVRRVDVIVEAKLNGQQYGDQWRREIQSYKLQSVTDDAIVGGADEAYFLAIGGLVGTSSQVVSRLSSHIPLSPDGSAGVVTAAADWSALVAVVHETEVEDENSQRILQDLAEALAFFGYRYVHSLSTLANFELLHSPEKALSTLRTPI